MKSKYKGVCNGLAIIVLIVGIIGSIFLANVYGEVKEVSYSTYSGISTETERSVPLTIAIFVSGAFGTSVLYVILAGLVEVLEYLERLFSLNSDENSELPSL